MQENLICLFFPQLQRSGNQEDSNHVIEIFTYGKPTMISILCYKHTVVPFMYIFTYKSTV